MRLWKTALAAILLGATGLAMAEAASPTHFQMVGTSATLMTSYRGRTGGLIKNQGPATIFCSVGTNPVDGGDPYYPDAGQITTVNGCLSVEPGASFPYTLDSPNDNVWCVAASAQLGDGGTIVVESRR